MDISVGKKLHRIEYDYPKFHLSMDYFACELLGQQEITLLEHDCAKWLTSENLYNVEWLPAEVDVLKKVEEKKNILKVVILGDVSVGKSNIIRRIMGQEFQDLEATVGVEYTYIDIPNIDPDSPNISLSIQIWDTCILYIIISWSRTL